jgi:hypothetical protein
LLYRWGNPRAYRSGSNVEQRLFAQHCAHWIAEGLPGEGDMLVFNNGMGRPDGAYSTVDEIAMPIGEDGAYSREEFTAFGPEEATWSYAAPDKTSFNSMLISGAQRLANGNTLICSGNQGILFEVTHDGEIVWQFKLPGVGFGGPPRMRPGELVPEFLGMMLAVSDEQRQPLKELQADVDARLSKLLTDEQRKKLEAPPAFPFGPGGPSRGPGGAKGAGGPKGGPGPGGAPFGFRPPRVGEVIPSFAIGQLELSDDQSKDLKELQEEVDERLAKIWTDAQKKQLKDMENAFARGPGAGPPGGFPPPGRGGPKGAPPGGDKRGPRGGPSGPGGTGGPGGFGGPPPGGPGGIFRSYRYALDYPGLAGKELKPGEKLDKVAAPGRSPPGAPPSPPDEATSPSGAAKSPPSDAPQ